MAVARSVERPSPSPGDETTPLGPWGRRVLVVLPFLLLGGLGEVFLTGQQGAREDAFRQRATEYLERLAVRGDDDLYAPLRLRRLLRVWMRTPPARRARVRERFVAGLGRGLTCEIYGFDEAGRLVPDQCHEATNRWLARTLYAALRASSGQDGEGPTRRRLERALIQTFGYGWTVNAYRRQRGLVTALKRQARDVWVAWDGDRRGGVVIICRDIPPVATRLVQALQQDREQGWTPLVWGSAQPALGEWQVGGPAQGETVRAIWHRFVEAGVESGEVLDRFWVFRQNARGRIFFAGFSRPTEEWGWLRWGWRLAMVLGMVGLLGASRRWAEGRSGSIRSLSVGLFLYSAFIPVIGLGLGALLLLQERAEVRGQEVQRHQMELLTDLDGRFPAYLKAVAEQVSRLSRAPGFAEDFAAAARLARPWLGGANPVARLEFRDGRGDLLWTSHPGQGGMRALLPVLTRLILGRWAPGRWQAPTAEADRLADRLFASPDLGLDPLANYPRSLLPVETGGKPAFIFWDFYLDPAVRAAVAFFLFSRDRLVTRYVQHQLGQRWGFRDAPLRLHAYDLERGAWLEQSFPGRQALVPLVLQASLMRRPKSGRIRLAGEEYHLAVLPARNLTQICLVAMFPSRTFQAELQGVRWRIAAGGVVGLLVALVLGNLIGRRLLEPVTHLSQGVEALRRRDFSTQVPVLGHDELGELARAFNAMAEDMRELDVARAVQAGLTPREFPRVPGYDLHGFTVFAGDLGGDCLDIRVLADGRVAVLIADVSGHGVGSALLMAFIKAQVCLWARHPSPTLEGLFPLLDRALREGERQRVFLAAFGVILDPARHALTFMAGGHPFPCLRRRSGAVESLGAPAYPLGSRRRPRPWPSGEIAVAPGDALLAFTDGLVEGLDEAGRPFGYEALTAWLAAHPPGGAASRWLLRLMEHYRRERPNAEDDITLFGLVRRVEDV